MLNTVAPRDADRISKVLLWWLLAVSASFLIGFLFSALDPVVSGLTWGVGTVFNVSMAVAIGVYFGWTRQSLQILIAVVFGAVVTILGLDFLMQVPSPTENAHFGLIAYAAFDSVGVLIALVGMTILIGGGALAGVIANQILSRSGCIAHARRSSLGRRGRMTSGQFNSVTFS